MTKHLLTRMHHFGLAVLFCNAAGCGTFLSVEETTPDVKQPDGIAVNKQVIYKVGIHSNEPVDITPWRMTKGPQIGGSDFTLRGIDENKMLSINATRMPFASGTLQITVTKEQLVSEVGITSETGAIRAIQAADTIVKTKNDLKK